MGKMGKSYRDPKHYVHESYPLPTELIGRLKKPNRVLVTPFYTVPKYSCFSE